MVRECGEEHNIGFYSVLYVPGGGEGVILIKNVKFIQINVDCDHGVVR